MLFVRCNKVIIFVNNRYNTNLKINMKLKISNANKDKVHLDFKYKAHNVRCLLKKSRSFLWKEKRAIGCKLYPLVRVSWLCVSSGYVNVMLRHHNHCRIGKTVITFNMCSSIIGIFREWNCCLIDFHFALFVSEIRSATSSDKVCVASISKQTNCMLLYWAICYKYR